MRRARYSRIASSTGVRGATPQAPVDKVVARGQDASAVGDETPLSLTKRAVTADGLAERAMADGEFRLAARYWTGSVELDFSDSTLCLAIVDGRAAEATASAPRGGQTIRMAAPADVWAKVLAPVPPPFFNDIMPAAARGLTIDAEPETFWQYYPAVRRLVDLLREELR